MPRGARAVRWTRLVVLLLLLAGSGVTVMRASQESSQGDKHGAPRDPRPERAAVPPGAVLPNGEAEPGARARQAADPWEEGVLWVEAGPGLEERWPVPLAAFGLARAGEGGGVPGPGEAATPVTWDPARVEAFLKGLAPEVYRPPQNARIQPGTGQLLPARPGRVLDVEASQRRIEEALRSRFRGSGPGSGPLEVRLVTRRLDPAVTLPELQAAAPVQPLARYSTYFDLSDAGRAANIRLAARLLDGMIIPPGGEFSFNEALGPRLPELGWRQAPELQGGEFVSGVGGGICQVSSTLFNTALLAGAEIVARRPHSRPVGYVPLGRDATVAWDTIDFRFRNPFPFPLVFQAEVVENRLSLSLWGSPTEDGLDHGRFDVVVEELLTIPPPAGVRWELDPGLPPGAQRIDEPARPGYRVRTIRVLYREGRVARREVVATSYYPPAPARGRHHPVSGAPARP